MNFKANDKVVCVNDDFRFSVFGIPRDRFHAPHGTPREGEVYCVRAVGPGEAGTQAVFLVGLSSHLDEHEVGFNSTRFRKVVDGGDLQSEADLRINAETRRGTQGNSANS